MLFRFFGFYWLIVFCLLFFRLSVFSPFSECTILSLHSLILVQVIKRKFTVFASVVRSPTVHWLIGSFIYAVIRIIHSFVYPLTVS